MMDKAMRRALEADGEKLRQLTGQDHGPYFGVGGCLDEEAPQQWFTCDACDGTGEEVVGYWGYEPGCGHGHTMEEGRPCHRCGGDGGWLDDVEGVAVAQDSRK